MHEEDILALYFARDERALKESEMSYGRYIQTVARNILNSEEDAREVANETWLAAWAAIPPARPENLRLFLARIARQRAINRREHDRAAKRGGGQYPLALAELAECVPAGGADPTDRLALEQALNAFLQAQSEAARRVFILRYFHMFSIAEIAERQGMGESQVKSILLRTRERLRAYLAKEELKL